MKKGLLKIFLSSFLMLSLSFVLKFCLVDIEKALKNYFLTRISTNQKPNSHEFSPEVIRVDSIKIRVDSCQKDFFSNLIDEKMLYAQAITGSLESNEPISSTMETAVETTNTDTEEEVSLESEAVSPLEKTDSGLLSLDFEDTEIRDVIRVLAEVSGMNIIVGPDVKAKVTVQLRNVSWQQALDLILRTYNLTFKKEEHLIRVMTLDQLKIEEEKIPLVTKIVPLNFADVEEILPSLEKMKSPRGSIQTNPRTNSLIITDLPDVVQQIEEVANRLDSRTPQVMIEALMADVKLTDEEQLGIDWNIKHPDRFYETTLSQALSLTGTASGAISFGKTIFQNIELKGLIEAWKEDKRVNILANPKVMTLDNLQATIELVEQIPYTSQSQSTSGSGEVVKSTQFKDAGIKLFVTPHITTKDNWISMNVKVEQSFRSGYTPDNQPIIDSRKAETNLMVKHGETIVIGGLRKKEDTVTVDKVPIFGDIPILGVLFRRTTKALASVDLLIFITPKVVEEPILTIKEKESLELFKYEPEDKTGISRKIREKIKEPKIKEKAEEGLKTIEEPRPTRVSAQEGFSLRPPGKED